MMLRLLPLLLVAGSVQAQDWKAVADGNRAFAFSLYRQVASEPGNVFFSPYSISTALAMTYVGARGETAAQMQSAMHFPESPEALPAVWAAWQQQVDAGDRNTNLALRVANSLWPDERHPFIDAYVATIRERFASDVFPVNFAETEAVRLRINTWVEEATEYLIKDLIKPGVLNPLTRMVLVNAIYFKGTWMTTFAPEVTRPQPFHLADGAVVEVPTMYGKMPARYATREGVQVLDLPYRGGEVSMLVVVPDTPERLAELERGLEAEELEGWLSGMEQTEVRVFLPKFTMTQQLGLKKTLQAMGMVVPFDETAANFAGMDGREGYLFISDVIHQAFVAVDEAGTEAAAATAVIMQARSMPRPSPEFRADRPFLFFIHERATGSILFAGRVMDPR